MQLASRFKRTFIGDRAFYRAVFAIVVPIIIQNSVTNFVSLLNNVMVSGLGGAQLNAVAVSNQLLFVFNLCIFGGLAGPGIFGAQYFGAGNMEGLRNTFRVKLWFSTAIILVSLVVFLGWGDRLIAGYLTGEGGAGEAAATLASGKAYLNIMLAGLVPFALTQCYSGTLREAGETILPMKAGVAAVLTNLCGNFLLIEGNLGFPKLGVQGAALATVISRFVELSIVMAGTHRSERCGFMRGAYHTLRVPAGLLRAVLKKGMPLLINEALWSVGVAVLMQIYSVRGQIVLTGLNIASNIGNLFNVVFISMGSAVGVMIGQSLGANDMQRARKDVWKLMGFSFFCCIVIGGVMAALSPLFSSLFKVDAEARALAVCFILTGACFMPINAIAHSCYFTLRSGGSTIVTFLFDSVYSWAVQIPFALLLVYKTDMSIMMLYPICQLTEALKSTIGLILVKKGVWLRNIVSGHQNAPEIAQQEG